MNSAMKQIARAAGTVMAAFLITQLIGLLRGILIYRAFGTSADLDSFNAANRVTEVLFNLMAGGALGSAFIPTFTGLLAQEKRASAWKLASGIANLLLIILTGISLLAFVFAGPVVRHGLFVLAPDLSVAQEDLTVALLRIMLPSVVIFGLSGLVMGILNAHQRFWLPAIAPAMYSIGQILGVLLFPPAWGIQRLAWGALLGALLHLLVQLPDLLRLGGNYSPTLGRGTPEVGEVLRLMGPRILGVAVVQLNFIVNTIVALSLPTGSVSAVSLAFTLMLMPQAAIAQSVAIAAMPTFSTQVALGRLDEMRSSLAALLRGVLLLAIPAALGLILLRVPIIRFLYEGGEFSPHSTALAAWALLWYAAGLPGHALVEILSRSFYALHDTKTPVGVGVAAMSLNVLFSFTLPGWFARLGWMPHGGLALANSLATVLEAVVLLVLMRRRLGGLQGGSIWQAAWQGLLAAALMGVALWIWLNWGPQSAGLLVLGGLTMGITMYVLGLAMLRVRELGLIAGSIWRRLRP